MWRIGLSALGIMATVAAVALGLHAGRATDSGPAASALAALRLEVVNLVAETDGARESGDPAILESAAALLAEREAVLRDKVVALGVSASALEPLSADVTNLVDAARAYAAGETPTGAGAAAYDRSHAELSALESVILAEAARREAARDQLRSVALALGAAGAGLLVGTGGAIVALERRAARQRAQREAVARLSEEAPVAFFRTGEAGRIEYVSPQVERVIGVPASAVLGLRLADVLTLPAGEPSCGPSATLRVEWEDAHGQPRRTVISGVVREDEHGFDRGWLRDSTEDLAEFRALRASEERLRAVLDHTEHGVAIIAGGGQILLHNRPLTLLLGYESAELEHLTLADLVPVDQLDQAMASITARLWSRMAPTTHELTLVRRDGEHLEVEVSLDGFSHGDAEPMVIAEIRDLTARRQASAALRRLVESDALTGLPNREAFLRYVDVAVQDVLGTTNRVAVLHLDVDRFKLVNDTLGHASGDQLLRKVADRLRGAMPPSCVVARFGGDEFLVMAPGLPPGGRERGIARRALDALAEPFEHEGREIRLHASVGLAVAPEHGSHPDDLVRHAVAAMYRAKHGGGNAVVVHDPSLDAGSDERLALESALRHAFERDEFLLHYQPEVDLATGRVAVVEALVRWERPEHGLIAPGDFIPLLEETGDIQRLGTLVLEQACGQAVAWEAEGLPPVRIAVNLSARQFLDEGLVGTVAEILERTGLPAERLELEITESTATLNQERAIEATSALRELGVRIAIDDFGTGHSSLQRLNEFPVHVLKVDRSFVAALGTDSQRALPILKSIVAVAHALSLEVVAEGIEGEVQTHILRGIGCDLGQGFLYAKPMPADDLGELLRRGALLPGHRASGAA